MAASTTRYSRPHLGTENCPQVPRAQSHPGGAGGLHHAGRRGPKRLDRLPVVFDPHLTVHPLPLRRLNEKTLFDEVVESFRILDKDGDGYLDRFDLKRVLLARGVAEEAA